MAPPRRVAAAHRSTTNRRHPCVPEEAGVAALQRAYYISDDTQISARGPSPVGRMGALGIRIPMLGSGGLPQTRGLRYGQSHRYRPRHVGREGRAARSRRARALTPDGSRWNATIPGQIKIVIARSESDQAIQPSFRDSGLLRFARNDD